MGVTTITAAESGLPDDMEWNSLQLTQADPWLCQHGPGQHSKNRQVCIDGHITEHLRNLGHL